MKKKFWMIICFMLSSCCVFAAPFNQLIFFGDSLTDNGNLYELLLKIVPKSPPYYQGRFTNGPTWAEVISKYYYDQSYMASKIYAMGGATAIYHSPTTNFAAPTNLDLEVNQYLIDTLYKAKSQTLVSIWIGGNDYLFYSSDGIETSTSKITNGIVANVNRLIKAGVQYFLIFNLPDLSKTPYAEPGLQNRLQLFSITHNQKLAAAFKKIKDSNPRVKIFYVNVFDIFNDVMQNPEKYNKKYHIQIKNVSQPCWTGPYWFAKLFATQQLEDLLRQNLINAQLEVHNRIDSKILGQFPTSSKNLTYSLNYTMLSQGNSNPCTIPNEYIFWDHLHPTSVVHEILSSIVIELLEA